MTEQWGWDDQSTTQPQQPPTHQPVPHFQQFKPQPIQSFKPQPFQPQQSQQSQSTQPSTTFQPQPQTFQAPTFTPQQTLPFQSQSFQPRQDYQQHQQSLLQQQQTNHTTPQHLPKFPQSLPTFQPIHPFQPQNRPIGSTEISTTPFKPPTSFQPPPAFSPQKHNSVPSSSAFPHQPSATHPATFQPPQFVSFASASTFSQPNTTQSKPFQPSHPSHYTPVADSISDDFMQFEEIRDKNHTTSNFGVSNHNDTPISQPPQEYIPQPRPQFNPQRAIGSSIGHGGRTAMAKPSVPIFNPLNPSNTSLGPQNGPSTAFFPSNVGGNMNTHDNSGDIMTFGLAQQNQLHNTPSKAKHEFDDDSDANFDVPDENRYNNSNIANDTQPLLNQSSQQVSFAQSTITNPQPSQQISSTLLPATTTTLTEMNTPQQATFQTPPPQSNQALSTHSSQYPAPTPQNPWPQYAHEDDVPLLEELGIDLSGIFTKSKMLYKIPFLSAERVLNHETDQNTQANTHMQSIEYDLTGPLMFCLMLGVLLMVTQGKMFFGYIYGYNVIGSICIWFLCNVLTDYSVNIDIITHVLGYSLSPMLLLPIIRFILYIGLSKDYIEVNGYYLLLAIQLISLVLILFSTSIATLYLEYIIQLQSQRYIIAYPLMLFYICFVILILF